MTAAPKISFVVPVYNMASFVAECLSSILAQDGDHDYEVIVVDDASTDSSVDVLSQFKDKRIQLIRHRENKGAAKTITEGLYAARGAYVARIDPDDRYRSHFLNRTSRVLDDHPEVGLTFGRIAMIDGTGIITDPGTTYRAPPSNERLDHFIHLLKRNDIPAPTVLARREAWMLGLPIPDQLKFNDWYLSLSIAERWPLFFVDEVLADYRIHDNNMHSAMIKERWAEPIILEVINKFLSAPGRESEKRDHRNEIYAAQYKQLADDYFGSELLTDARRCYFNAILHSPGLVGRSEVLRRFLGTFLGRAGYKRVKGLTNRALGR
jgi:glycosyltransferase involved in cell wall biosynthesis